MHSFFLLCLLLSVGGGCFAPVIGKIEIFQAFVLNFRVKLNDCSDDKQSLMLLQSDNVYYRFQRFYLSLYFQIFNLVIFFVLVLWLLAPCLSVFLISKFTTFQPSKTTDKQQLFKHLTKYNCKNILYSICISSIKRYI